MNAAQEEKKYDEMLCDDKMISNGVEEREPSQKMIQVFNKIFSVMTETKTDSNTFGYGLRIFKLPGTTKQGFPRITKLRQMFSKTLSALYIFKLHYPHPKGHTHGIHLRINGYAPRYILDQLIQESIKLFSGEAVQLDAVLPHVTKDMSLFDYLETLYVVPANLLVNYSHKQDAVPEEMPMKLDYNVVAKLKDRIQYLTSQILDNILAMPLRYHSTYMASVMSMHPADYKLHMRQTTLKEMSYKAGENAYCMALQDYKFRQAEVQELMDPITRRAMLNRCVTEKTTKQIQLLLQQNFGSSFVHPHPYNGIIRVDLNSAKAIDGMMFDPRFLFPLLMTARWFARTCMRREESVSNNHSHLLLYGNTGTGKTLIVSSISSVISTYKLLVTSKFQNPDLLQSSLFSIEEFDTSILASNQYKALLDYKSPVKIDFKNLHPENVSEGVPCMITTNDDVLTVLRSQKRYNQQSADAAIRRLYLIPLKMGAFEKLHGKIAPENQFYSQLAGHNPKFDGEINKLVRIFNLILAFGLHQGDITNLFLNKRLQGYFERVIDDFKRTIFGTFYLSNKRQIDDIIQETEQFMMRKDINDTEYLAQFAISVGQFQQHINQFIIKAGYKLKGFNSDIIKDPTIPHSIKYYYLKQLDGFTIKMMWEIDENEQHVNPEVLAFMKNPSMQLFTFPQVEQQVAIGDPYPELLDVDSVQEQEEPFKVTGDLARQQTKDEEEKREVMELIPDYPFPSPKAQLMQSIGPPVGGDDLLDQFMSGSKRNGSQDSIDHLVNEVTNKRFKFND